MDKAKSNIAKIWLRCLASSARFASRSAFVVFVSLIRRLAARCFSACRRACELLFRFAGVFFFVVLVFFSYLPATLSPNYFGAYPPSIQVKYVKRGLHRACVPQKPNGQNTQIRVEIFIRLFGKRSPNLSIYGIRIAGTVFYIRSIYLTVACHVFQPPVRSIFLLSLIHIYP